MFKCHCVICLKYTFNIQHGCRILQTTNSFKSRVSEVGIVKYLDTGRCNWPWKKVFDFDLFLLPHRVSSLGLLAGTFLYAVYYILITLLHLASVT